MNKEFVIREWGTSDQDKVIKMIIDIQRDEFGINITKEDQPDLKMVDKVFQKDGGNFWVGVNGDDIVGSIGLVHFTQDAVALRKMFVAKPYRGKETGLAQTLLDTALTWCNYKNLDHIYLGTIDVFTAAHRFYERNGFEKISPADLPKEFPRMKVDTIFYHLNINR